MSKHKEDETAEVSPEAADVESAGENQAPAGSDEPGAASLEEQLQTAICERDETHDRWLRGQAELENYRRRAQKELLEVRKFQAVPLVRDLLPGFDNLERAIQAAENTSSVGDLVEGMQMVLKQFESILANHAVVVIEAVGQTFDPNLHEAVQQVQTDEHPPMTVLQELERGYMMNDRVVRPAKVIVSSGS